MVGVTSRGEGCGWAGYPGIYIEVADYISWIEDTIAKDERGEDVSVEATTRRPPWEDEEEQGEEEYHSGDYAYPDDYDDVTANYDD